MTSIKRRARNRPINEGDELDVLNREIVPLLLDMLTEMQKMTGDVVLVDDDHNVLVSDRFVLCADGVAFTCSLYPAADAPYNIVTFKKCGNSAHNIVVDGSGSETVDGALTRTLAQNYGTMTIMSDGTEWFIIAGAGT